MPKRWHTRLILEDKQDTVQIFYGRKVEILDRIGSPMTTSCVTLYYLLVCKYMYMYIRINMVFLQVFLMLGGEDIVHETWNKFTVVNIFFLDRRWRVIQWPDETGDPTRKSPAGSHSFSHTSMSLDKIFLAVSRNSASVGRDSALKSTSGSLS